MDVANTSNNRVTDPTEAENRAQAMRNAVSQLQARYGEKPKEARQIKKSLDKDDFMRIMITEMKNQDPTKPMDADKMATQMAQLTSVEQLKNMGSAIEKLADRNQASDRMAMSGMIGKTVTVDKGRFSHIKGNYSALNFDLPQDAQKIRLKILDERGEEIATQELEPMKAGPNVYNWDGMNSSGISVASGNFMVRIEAENKEGAGIQVNPISKETIMGVAFEGGEANFLVGNPKSPQKVPFKNVTRIEADSGQQQVAVQAKSQDLAAKSAEQPELGSALPEGLQEKLKMEMAAKADVSASAEVSEPEVPSGFPNGLQDEGR
jgi:flagellar basal-body rod modification protein FlgD